ncbi:MAG TPA: hypothetical protein PK581_06925 [Caldisericia bacterium]|nr:hypothetical protein [Caldisericia bacterium]
MKTIIHLFVFILFLLFLVTSFIHQKTIIFFHQDSYYSYITYTRTIHDFAQSIQKPYLLWRLEENKPTDRIHEGMMIKLSKPLAKDK